MQADRAYNGSAKYVKHQKLDQSASLFFLLTPATGELLTSLPQGKSRPDFLSPSVLMGCTGNALATGIDAPPGPKVSSISDRVPLVSGGTGELPKCRPPKYLEPCNLAGKDSGVKEFVRNRTFDPGCGPSC